MPQGQWSNKRERQYEHIKSGLKERGFPEDSAELVAARTVNQERARSGESKQRSRSDSGSKGRTKEQLYSEAKRKGIKGRSKMTKAQLARALH